MEQSFLRKWLLNSSVFWDIKPFSPLKINRRFGLTCCKALAACFMMVSCLAYSSTLNMEAICSSEKSVDFQRTIQRYVPEVFIAPLWEPQNLQNDSCSESQKILPHFIEPESLFRLSQEPATGPYPDPVESSLHPHTLFLNNLTNRPSVTLPSVPRSSKGPISFRLCH
jgi:hypothetical protein